MGKAMLGSIISSGEIKKENIIGIVRFKIPYLGYPTVWFSEI